MALSKEELKRLQDACRQDLKFLCTKFLGMDAWASPLHDDLATFLDGPDHKKLILIPRGHLKSSIVTVGWTIQQILRDFNTRVLIASATWDRAREFLAQISGYLTDKSPLCEIFGAFDGPGSKFTQDRIEISQKTSGTARGATVRTAGIETALTGGHPDIIILDDLVEENNISTKEQIQKVIRFYENSLDLLDPGGKLLVVGTRWAESDLYGHIIINEMDSLNMKPVKPEDRVLWRELLRTNFQSS